MYYICNELVHLHELGVKDIGKIVSDPYIA